MFYITRMVAGWLPAIGRLHEHKSGSTQNGVIIGSRIQIVPVDISSPMVALTSVFHVVPDSRSAEST